MLQQKPRLSAAFVAFVAFYFLTSLSVPAPDISDETVSPESHRSRVSESDRPPKTLSYHHKCTAPAYAAVYFADIPVMSVDPKNQNSTADGNCSSDKLQRFCKPASVLSLIHI